MTDTIYRDSPFEKRAAELKFIHTAAEDEELAFLEDYLRWKSTCGPAKLDAQRNAERQAELRKSNQERLRRKEKQE